MHFSPRNFLDGPVNAAGLFHCMTMSAAAAKRESAKDPTVFHPDFAVPMKMVHTSKDSRKTILSQVSRSGSQEKDEKTPKDTQEKQTQTKVPRTNLRFPRRNNANHIGFGLTSPLTRGRSANRNLYPSIASDPQRSFPVPMR